MKRDERLNKDRAILEELIAEGGLKEYVRSVWCRRARRKQAAFYLRLGELSPQIRGRFEDLPDARIISTDAYYDLSNAIDIVKERCREAGRPATLDDLRTAWEEKMGHSDLNFNVYWNALPNSDRRDMIEPPDSPS